ncbi:conjugal transfer protein TraC, partial [Chryseobacterium phosphatilyticum]
MARSKSRETIVNEITALQAKLRAHDKAEAERLGNLAIKSGIGAIDISD